MLSDPMTVERRVTNLEELMAQLIAQIDRTDRQLDRTDRQLAETAQQLAQTDRQLARTDRRHEEFKVEMRAFKDEMSTFKDEMSEFKDEMRAYRDKTDEAILEYRNRTDAAMAQSKKESEDGIIQMRKQWGELSNRLGTMAEDLVAPSVSRILHQLVGCPEDRVDYVAVRVRKAHPTTRQPREFDVVAVCGDYLLINETKSSLSAEKMQEFIQHLTQAREYFAEYTTKKIIGVIASLYVDASLVRHGERLGLVVLGFGDDVMQVLNRPGFELKFF